jgi:hypothetical protein
MPPKKPSVSFALCVPITQIRRVVRALSAATAAQKPNAASLLETGRFASLNLREQLLQRLCKYDGVLTCGLRLTNYRT